MSIYYKIRAYLEKDFELKKEVSFEDDNGTITITHWNEESLGKSKPTLDQLNALETEATKLQNNAIAVANRQKEYGTPEKMIEYITENGLEAWQSKVQEIKTKYPKESE